MASISFTMLPSLCIPVLMASYVGETSEIFRNLDNHATTVTAVAAVRSTAWDVRFTPKAQTTVAAIACSAVYRHVIDKHDARRIAA